MSDDADDLEDIRDGLPDDEDELLRKLQGWERRARSHWSTWREEAQEDFAFVAGDQWTSEDKARLLEEMRVPITFNRTAPMIDAVTGAEVLNRQEVRYLPREMGDVQVNEVLGAAAEWARDQSDAEDEESDAFSDTVVCGMGWIETRMDYEEDAEGMIRIDRIDPLEMWADPSAKKRNLTDRKYQFRGHWRQRDDLPPEWREKIGAMTGSGAPDSYGTGHTGRGDDYLEGEDETENDPGEADKKRVWIRHFQWFDVVDAYRIADPMTGRVATLKSEELAKIKRMYAGMGMQPPQTVKIRQRQYMEAWLAGGVVLESRPIKCNKFTYSCITGKRDRNRGVWHGVVRALKDPQMWANKWLSQVMHILNTQAKGGVLYEEGVFANLREAQDKWARPDAMIELKPGTLGRGAIQQREAASFPAGLDRLLAFSVDSMPQVTGINLELLGLVQKEQAGVLEAQRKQAGYAILAVFFDSLRRYRKVQGRVMLYYIQHYISDGRLIRVMGENGNEQYVPLVRDKGTFEYDVIVDEAPMSANQKEAVWQMMVQMMPILTKQPLPGELWAEILKHSPLPSSVSSKIASMITNDGEPSPEQQAQEQAMALELAEKAAQIEKTKAETAKIASELQTPVNDAGAEILDRQMEAEARAREFEMKRAEHQLKLEAFQAQHAMKAEEHAWKREDAAMQMQAKRELAETERRSALSKGGFEEAEDGSVNHPVAKSLEVVGNAIGGLSQQLTDNQRELLAAIAKPRETIVIRDKAGRVTGARAS